MSNEKERLWTAYLDEELSETEARAFEEQLTESERESLAADARYEAAVAARLSEDVKCPDDLWQRVQGEIWQAQANEARLPSQWTRWAIPALAAAAAIIVFVTFFVPTGFDGLPAFLEPAAANVPDLKAMTEVEPNRAAVEDFMRQAGMRITLQDHGQQARRGHHPVQLYGASKGTVEDGDVVRVLYSCCRLPLEVIVAQEGGAAANAINKARAGKRLRHTKDLKGYVIAVVGSPHHGGQILRLVQDE
jgi:hypothetical protein